MHCLCVLQAVAAREAVTDALIVAATQRDDARFVIAVAYHRLEALAMVRHSCCRWCHFDVQIHFNSFCIDCACCWFSAY
jgi:hypothetical protein